MSREVAIAIDLGGTHLKSGVVNSRGKILHQTLLSSCSQSEKRKVLENILSAIFQEQQWAKNLDLKIKGVGLGIPGIISYATGMVHRSPHVPDWIDFPIRRHLQKHLKIPFILDNDANMAALGEGWLGAGKGKKNFILLTLGTGIGGGIVIGERIFHGDSGFAGEVGHLVLEKEGLPCNCGGRGCLEMYASATGILHEWQTIHNPSPPPLNLRGGEKIPPLMLRGGQGELPNAQETYKLTLKGDKQALKIYKKFGEALGAGIASLVNILDIETVILGGGLSGAWKVFEKPLRGSLARHTYPTTAKRVILKRALLGNRAGMVGAARAIFLSWH